MDLVRELRQGRRRAIARAISMVEDGGKEGRDLIKNIQIYW